MLLLFVSHILSNRGFRIIRILIPTENDTMDAFNQPNSASDLFEAYTVEDLKKMGAYLLEVLNRSGIRPPKLEIPPKATLLPSRKAQRIEWIQVCLTHEPFLRYLYDQMTDLEQAAVQEMVHATNGVLEMNRFEAKYGDFPQTAYSAFSYHYGRKKDDRFPPLALFVLQSRWMPREFQALFQNFVPKPQSLDTPILDHLPERVPVAFYNWDDGDDDETAPLIQHLTEQAAFNDLTALLHLIDQGKVSVSNKTGKPTKACIKSIRNILFSGDFYDADLEAHHRWDVQMGAAGIRPFAWIMLLQAGGLAKASGTKLVLSRTGRAALTKPTQDVIAQIWPKWLNNKLMHEMSRIEVIKGQKSRGRPLYVAPPCRQNIAAALAELEAGQWIKTIDFFKFLIANNHDFDVVRDGWGLYLGDPHYGSFGYSHITWEHVNGRFARALLLEYAATLGLIDVALVSPWGALNDLGDLWGADDLSCLSRYDGLWALRLNSLGAWVFGKKPEYTPEFYDDASIRVLPNLEIVPLSSVAASADELFLGRFCRQTSERVWRIDLKRLLAAVEEGIDLASIVSFLGERNADKMPQPVQTFFDDVRSRIGKVQDVGDAVLIKCADEALARLIASDTEMQKLCLPAGDTFLAVPKDNQKRFRKALQKLGYVLSRK